LKANAGFQDLRVQLEGTENRVTVARNRYIKTVAEYNVLARQFPTNLTAMLFSYAVKPSFTVANEAQISVPPTVSFDKAPTPAPAASK
jgi:LemA protein